MKPPESNEEQKELHDKLDQMSYNISKTYNEWLEECIDHIREEFEFTQDKPRTRRREFERYVKKNCIVKTIKQPTDADSDNEFVWELWDGNYRISQLKISLNKKEEDNDDSN